jgi:hypothetical protein
VDPVAGPHALGLAAGDAVDVEAVGVLAVVVGEQRQMSMKRPPGRIAISAR